MAVHGSIDGERRRKDLVGLAESDGEISIERAREMFDVSAMTIRRDLELLEVEGLLRRVRGGAIPAPHPRSYDDRLAARAGAKRIIAEKARALVPDRGRISLDASTTMNALADTLAEHRGLAVCTSSVQTFQLLSRHAGVEALLTGGAYDADTGSLVGPLANAGARALSTDAFFTSAAALDASMGTSEVSLAEAEVKRNLAACSRMTVLCVDATKLGSRSVGGAFELSEISVLVTDLDPADERLDPYRSIADIR